MTELTPWIEFGNGWAKIHYRRETTEQDRAALTAAFHGVDGLARAKNYVDKAIASYAGDPADNQFQKGYLAALEVIRDEAFSGTVTVAQRQPEPGDAFRTVTIVIPSGYKDAAEFLADCQFEEAPQPLGVAQAAQYEFPYQRTFEAIAAATSVYAEGVGVNVSVAKFQEAFNNHRDAKPLSPLPSTHRVCPRCKKEPIDPALLGAADEGHICGTCWTSDRVVGGGDAGTC